jgi:hypothetical protein
MTLSAHPYLYFTIPTKFHRRMGSGGRDQTGRPPRRAPCDSPDPEGVESSSRGYNPRKAISGGHRTLKESNEIAVGTTQGSDSAWMEPSGAARQGRRRSLQHIPLCHSASQTGCVITYASFRATAPPPPNSRFGRVPGEAWSKAARIRRPWVEAAASCTLTYPPLAGATDHRSSPSPG